jgi:uncharacterized protein DUF3224
MTYVRTPVETSAGYVAIERITAVLDGRQGSFVLLHVGMAHNGESSLEVSVVPDSGTGELTGITGSMAISEIAGDHHYRLDYQLPG